MVPQQTETRPLTRKDWFLLVETTTWLLLSRLAVLVLPFSWVMRSAGEQNAQSAESIPAEQNEVIDKVTWAIDAVRWATPWDSNCLARSLAGKRLLRKRGMASTLYLGVSKSDPSTLIAHAWLRCGQDFITGEPGHEQFTVVATFAEQ